MPVRKRQVRVTKLDIARARADIQAPTIRQRKPESDGTRPRRDRAVKLPSGEIVDVDAWGWAWTHRVDYDNATPGTGDIVRIIPVKLVCLGPVQDLLKPQKLSPGNSELSIDKTPNFASDGEATRPVGHLQDDRGFGTVNGRPKVVVPLELIKSLADEGLGVRAIAQRLKQRGYNASYRTIHRRLALSG